MFVSLFRLIFCFIFVLPGDIMTLPLSTAIAFYSERERIKALKASTVKIKANDVLSSIKILAYISSLPVYVMFFTFVFYRMMRFYFEFSRFYSYYYSLTFFILFPIIQFISIRSHDGVKTHYTQFQGRFLSLFYPDQVDMIKTSRKMLKRKVRATVDRIGPKIFKNFDKMKLIMFDPSISQKNRDDASSVAGGDLTTSIKKNKSLTNLEKKTDMLQKNLKVLKD